MTYDRSHCARDEKRPETSFWREILLQPLNMCLLTGIRSTGAYINAELHHLIAVINEILAKVSRGFALLLRSHRQIKSDN